MKNVDKIKGTIEAWEKGDLGRDERFVARAPKESEQQLDESLGMQAISIRLPKDLIEQFKLIAKINGVGYQPLMRDALKRFAESETKIILTKMAEDKKRQEELTAVEHKRVA